MSMHSFVARFSSSAADPLSLSLQSRNATQADDEDAGIPIELWGSQAGFGSLASQGGHSFAVPKVPNPAEFLRMHTDEHEGKIKIQHGTTCLAFRFKGGVIVAVDSRASAGSYIASGTVKKVLEINKYLLGTMAGGGADCQYWETYLGIQCRLHELRNGERMSVAAASKYLANLVYGYKGMGLSMATMICGWDKSGPAVYYVDSDGTRMKGDVFSVGSGSTFAYGVLDQGYKWDLSDEEAQELGRRSIYAAGHRDAYTGNTVNLYHVRENGWEFINNYDISKLHYEGPGGITSEGYGYSVRTAEQTSRSAENDAMQEVEGDLV
ncbi:N-terminal nucleophile aminohydrolase [Exidia glandulosa HHB12029]|uniref:proteasome endopeptidase complex n=1 Tax=Exidia glandulosa HHB12029 TaxID=1314781 RepID=A0A165CDN0_EXIGL|nr:N-terminal nucleophile aminohydrolase [Exidia glandulosa HHB12029]